MGNVFRAWLRDLIRLLKSPSALIVMIALLVLPSAYTWYNVAAFWSPYDNTSNMRVCVVNEDTGSSSDLTGDINVGDLIVDKLEENTQLGWDFQDYDSAMDSLYAGKCYAVFVVPENFTSNILSITSGSFEKPVISYYVNEKAGPVSPKVTDSGKTVLEETINSTFVKTVSETVVDVVDDAIAESDATAADVKSNALEKLSEAIADLDDAQSSLSKLDSRLSSLESAHDKALSAIDFLEKNLDKAGESLGEVSYVAEILQGRIDALTPKASQSVAAALVAVSNLAPYAEAAGYGEEVNAAIKSLETYSDSLFVELLPSATRGLSKLSSAAGALDIVMSGDSTTLQQSRVFVNQLNETVGDIRTSLQSTSTLLGSVKGDLQELHDDLALFTLGSLTSLLGVDGSGLDASSIADFMSSPTKIKTEKLYGYTSYGAAMGPLFMNLTFWIGAFMFLVVFKNVSDDEGIKKFTIQQRYLSRFLLFSVPAAIQGIVCCAGLMVMGISVANAPALFIAAVVCSLAYLSIIYALSLMFMHVGKGLCVFLVFLQIPSATGLYPIQMTADFYQALCPLFPFTYGIGAVREAICGFYGTTYFADLGALAVFFFLFMILGLTFQPLLANVNRMAASQVSLSGLLNGDRIDLPSRNFKTVEVVKRLADSDEYGRSLQARFDRFARLYPRMVRVTLVLVVLAPLATGIFCALLQVERPVTLTIWLVIFIAIIIFLVALETFKHSFVDRFAMSTMSDEELVTAVAERDVMHETEDSASRAHEETDRFWDPDAKREVAKWRKENLEKLSAKRRESLERLPRFFSRDMSSDNGGEAPKDKEDGNDA